MITITAVEPVGQYIWRPARAARQGANSTLALATNGDARQNHRIDKPVLPLIPLQHAETARLAQYEPSVPATLLLPDINRRVHAALTAFGCLRLETAAGVPETRERITANARYIARELGQLRLGQRAAGDLLHTERLHAAFTGELPASVNDRVGQLRREGVRGAALRDALAELEARLSPPTPPSTATGGIKIACSMSAT